LFLTVKYEILTCQLNVSILYTFISYIILNYVMKYEKIDKFDVVPENVSFMQ